MMEQTKERHEGTVITQAPILDFLTQYELNPNDFRMTNIFTFEQAEENGEYQHTGVSLHVVKKEHTDEAFIVNYNFDRRKFDLSNEEGATLDVADGLRYRNEPDFKPTFFEVEELYRALELELPEEL